MRFTDPEDFEATVATVAGNAKIRPAKGARFSAELELVSFEKVGLYTVRSDSFEVSIEPPHDFFSVNIPLDLPFQIGNKSNRRLYTPGDAYLLRSDSSLDLRAETGCQVLVGTFFKAPLLAYVRRLNQTGSKVSIPAGAELSLSSPRGINLQRVLAHSWSNIRYNGANISSRLWVKEHEDQLLSSFAYALVLDKEGGSTLHQASPACLRTAEEYICANLEIAVTRDRLAEISGASIRTLSRAFMKRHGVGPMGFLKQRRLDAAYRSLLGSEPGATTVTDIALRYGFVHMGKFSTDYRMTFGEHPSTSLAR